MVKLATIDAYEKVGVLLPCLKTKALGIKDGANMFSNLTFVKARYDNCPAQDEPLFSLHCMLSQTGLAMSHICLSCPKGNCKGMNIFRCHTLVATWGKFESDLYSPMLGS